MDAKTIFFIFFVFALIGCTISLNLCKKIAKETGKDLWHGFLRKFLLSLGGFGLMIVILSAGESSSSSTKVITIIIGILFFIIGAGVLFLLSYKITGIKTALILTVSQVVFGYGFVFMLILQLIGKLMPYAFNTGGSVTETKTRGVNLTPYQREYEKQRHAEAVAGSHGLRNPQEAEDVGISTGIYD